MARDNDRRLGRSVWPCKRALCTMGSLGEEAVHSVHLLSDTDHSAISSTRAGTLKCTMCDQWDR